MYIVLLINIFQQKIKVMLKKCQKKSLKFSFPQLQILLNCFREMYHFHSVIKQLLYPFNLLLQYYDLAADVLAENAHLTYKYLTPVSMND